MIAPAWLQKTYISLEGLSTLQVLKYHKFYWRSEFKPPKFTTALRLVEETLGQKYNVVAGTINDDARSPNLPKAYICLTANLNPRSSARLMKDNFPNFGGECSYNQEFLFWGGLPLTQIDCVCVLIVQYIPGKATL